MLSVRPHYWHWDPEEDAYIAALVEQFPDMGVDLDMQRRVLRYDGGTAPIERIRDFMRSASGHVRSGVGTEDDVIHFGLDFPKRYAEDGWASWEYDGGWGAYCEMCSWWFDADSEAGIEAQMSEHDRRVHHRR
jgi:hypothetical protein